VGALTRKLLIALAALLLLALMGYGVYKMTSGKSKAPHKAPKISLIPSTPPPPPPPPKEQPKPEPPKEQKEVKIDQVAPPKEAAPAAPSQELKMDGPAGDGPSAFASGAITRDDLSNLGKGGAAPVVSGLFNPFKNYATLLKGELQRHLARNKDLRQRSYRLELQLWVGRDGSVTRQELVGSSGDTEIDAVIRQSVSSLGAFSQVPPERMPQPIRLLLVTGTR
jgi:outer membrane biosynthesis protein TonB